MLQSFNWPSLELRGPTSGLASSTRSTIDWNSSYSRAGTPNNESQTNPTKDFKNIHWLNQLQTEVILPQNSTREREWNDFAHETADSQSLGLTPSSSFFFAFFSSLCLFLTNPMCIRNGQWRRRMCCYNDWFSFYPHADQTAFTCSIWQTVPRDCLPPVSNPEPSF